MDNYPIRIAVMHEYYRQAPYSECLREALRWLETDDVPYPILEDEPVWVAVADGTFTPMDCDELRDEIDSAVVEEQRWALRDALIKLAESYGVQRAEDCGGTPHEVVCAENFADEAMALLAPEES